MVDFQDNKQEFFMKNLLPEQCRAARGLLNWTQERLAALAGVSRSTVRDFENGPHQLHRATESLLVDALGRSGIRLVSYQREVGMKLRRGPARPGGGGRCRGPTSPARGATPSQPIDRMQCGDKECPYG